MEEQKNGYENEIELTLYGKIMRLLGIGIDRQYRPTKVRLIERQTEVGNELFGKDPAIEWSMSYHTEEEITHMILTNPDMVYYTYICHYCRLSESFIDDLMLLSTEAFNEETWKDEKKRDLIRRMLELEDRNKRKEYIYRARKKAIQSGEDQDMIKFLQGITSRNSSCRLDWHYIYKYQNLSDQFLIDHARQFKGVAPIVMQVR